MPFNAISRPAPSFTGAAKPAPRPARPIPYFNRAQEFPAGCEDWTIQAVTAFLEGQASRPPLTVQEAFDRADALFLGMKRPLPAAKPSKRALNAIIHLTTAMLSERPALSARGVIRQVIEEWLV